MILINKKLLMILAIVVITASLGAGIFGYFKIIGSEGLSGEELRYQAEIFLFYFFVTAIVLIIGFASLLIRVRNVDNKLDSLIEMSRYSDIYPAKHFVGLGPLGDRLRLLYRNINNLNIRKTMKISALANLNEFMMNRGSFLSSNVYVPDNSGIDTLERDTITSEIEHDDLGIVSPNENFGVPSESSNKGANKTQTNNKGKGTASNKEINTSTDVKELSNDIKNVEESNTVSKESKDKIKKKQEKEKKDIEKSKPKLIIKIPIPYTDQFITIKLGTIFKVLAGAALLALVAKLLTGLSSNLSKGFPIQEQDFDIDQDDIKKELNDIDINDLNTDDLKTDGNELDYDADADDKDNSDKYIKNKKVNKNKKSEFSYLNRGRNDILDSDNVKDRNPQDKGNKKNNNYGDYY